MASMMIRSRLKHFRLVARITQVCAASIQGKADFVRMPAFGGLEAMAQLAALHVRHCLRFQRHAFLLKVNTAQWPAEEFLEGCYRISADLSSQGSDAFAYRVTALGPDSTTLHAELIIGTKAYDDIYQEEILKRHYRELFEDLQLGR